MRQSQTARRARRSIAALATIATIVGSALAGLHAGDVAAGQGADIVLSTTAVAPRQGFDALFNCPSGTPIEYRFRGASSTINCGEAGIARAPLTAPDELGQFEVTATVAGDSLSATVVVVAPGRPTLASSGAFSPNLPLSFGITGCAEGSQPVGEFDGQQTTEPCRVGQNGQTFAVFAYLGPGEPGIYPVTATLDPDVVLTGAIYVAGDLSSPGPELPVSGPADSTAMQLVIAAAVVGAGASLVAWSRRWRATNSAR